MDYHILPYRECDKEQVFAFTDACFTELGKSFDPDGRHSFYQDISKSFTAFWCMFADDVVIGTVALKKHSSERTELKALYLAKESRGRGFGAQLLQTALHYAEESGFQNVVLDSMSQYTAALRLYEKAGFRQIERFNDNLYADVFMQLDFDRSVP